MPKKRKPEKPKAKSQDTSHIRGLVLLVCSLGICLSLLSFGFANSTNWLGLVGASIGWVFQALFGLSSYVICVFLGWIGWRLLFHKPINHPSLKLVSMGLFVFSMCMLLNLIEHQYPAAAQYLNGTFTPSLYQKKLKYHLGGAPFFYLYRDIPILNFHNVFNSLGVAIIFGSIWIGSWMYLAKVSPKRILNAFTEWFKVFKADIIAGLEAGKKASETGDVRSGLDDLRMVKLKIPQPTETHVPQDMLAIQPETNLKVRPSISRKEFQEPNGNIPFAGESRPLVKPVVPTLPSSPVTSQPQASVSQSPPSSQKKREAALAAQRVHNGDYTEFKVPSPSMLTNPKKVDHNLLKKDLKRQAEVLEETLASFGIEAKVGQINCGPTITSFEVHPAIGVKVQRIKALENDIALNMEAKSIRIIAPIPGKAAVGIEVPNSQPQEVAFKDMLQAYQQSGRKFHIPVLLGKAVNGDNVMSDLTKMPHCIIAGATGSGKSVCINTIVMSIVMNTKPDEVKMIMVDPKKVELTPYTNLPHMLAPVITEPQGACAALNWLVKEMERRYEILKLTGVRNIDAFNSRTINKEQEEALNRDIPEKMPYMVGIIDELADLMMVASSDIETPIARIAQMARAVGIHLILATQRPSREVITGLIKANFPTRVSFKVASRVNSQIVLDEVGAESLLGNGDMLFLPPGSSHLVRAQGAFIRDEDINSIVKFICEQAPPNYQIQSFDRMEHLDDSDEEKDEPVDEMYNAALDLVLSTGTASATFLQRKLKVGYPKAASLIDSLETKGIIGPAEGSKPRKILVSRAGRSPNDVGLTENIDEVL